MTEIGGMDTRLFKCLMNVGSDHRYVIAITYVCLFVRSVFHKSFVFSCASILVKSFVFGFLGGRTLVVNERTAI